MERGHPVAIAAEALGGGQGVMIDAANGVLVGGSDPRKDGAALGW
jgi:gamma-glutamyltranspeptidase/glutathione hydrolase